MTEGMEFPVDVLTSCTLWTTKILLEGWRRAQQLTCDSTV